MNNISTRDNRTHSTFHTHFDIVFEWLPFIGPNAFTLYSFYLAMAERGRVMGVRAIGKRAGIGYASVQRYTAILEHCRLIEKEQGNPRHPNTITITDPPTLDYQIIEYILEDILADEHLPQLVKTAMVKRGAKWQPMPAAPIQAAITLNGNSTPQTTDVAAIVSRLQRVCQEHGSNEGAYFNGATKFVASSDQALLTGWLDAIEDGTVDLVKIDGVAGWIRNKVTGSEQPPRPLIDPHERGDIPEEYAPFVKR